MQFDLFDQEKAKAQVGERQTDLESLLESIKANDAKKEAEWIERAKAGECGVDWLTRFDAGSYPVKAVGEIPDFNPLAYDFLTERDIHFWNAGFIPITMALCHDSVKKANLVIDDKNVHRVGALIGSAINGNDSYEQNLDGFAKGGFLKVSPFSLGWA